MATSSRSRTSTLYESRDSSEQSDVSFAQRPSYGVMGHIIRVTANCCRIVIAKETVGRTLYKYAVEMRINGIPHNNPRILRRIFWEVVEKHKKAFPPYGIVFNDRNALFSAQKIEVDRFEVHFGRDNSGTITLELKNEVRFDFREYGDLQIECLNALLTQQERCMLTTERKFFVHRDNLFIIPDQAHRINADYIGRGLQMWYALHSLVSLGERSEAIVNYDRTCSVFLKMKMPIIDYYICFVNKRSQPTEQDYARLRNMSLNANQRNQLRESLKGLSFVATYGNEMHYKFFDVLDTDARSTVFEWEDRETGQKERISVQDYFYKHWNIRLQLPHFPLIQMAPHMKRIFVPLELLLISDRPQRFQKPIPDECMAAALKLATITPRERFKFIQQLMEEIRINEKSKFMTKFGVNVDKRMIRTDARVLPLPMLTVRDGREQVQPDNKASWAFNKVQSNGHRRTIVGVIVDDDIRQSLGNRFINLFNVLIDACRQIGVDFVDHGYFEPCSQFLVKSRDDIEHKVTHILDILYREYEAVIHECNVLILFVNSEKSDLHYGDLKATCELKYSVCSQVILQKTFEKLADPRSPANPRTGAPLPSATARNIALKINAKLGGVTTAALPRQLEWSTFTSQNEPTLFIGIDVSFSRAEGEVSLFAASGSTNLEATQYQTTITPISPVTGYSEAALDLRVAVETSLKAFYKETQLYPAHIVFYRMGCSRSLMDETSKRELRCIFGTIKDMAALAPQGLFDPTVTYIQIERNHQKRFKVDEQNLRMPQGYAGSWNNNVPAGTVVEKVVTSAKVFDFYLCSHHGALGTSRPTRYIVYYDDWCLTADQIQHASFCLCFLTSNCTRAVSIPAPTYYASKGCERGRKYLHSCQLQNERIQPYEPLDIPVFNSMYIV
ncbi:hypothetical protein QR680_000362 [Steinernema hermaphroditum]|uniref:Piwi domain-containing protein n=1 Tax=Steinernema hermaphroditum TaxID=289476 RepID=A0AA39GUB2_9BILA|nr:hypothetical protein QR680_000362 [Steinernema hermaphroditum]